MTIKNFSQDYDPYPVGTVKMWYGNIADIPQGWFICNGKNGTPDLRDRFVRSVPNSTTDPGAVGGNNSYTLTEAQLPSHSHGGGTTSDNKHNHTYGENDDWANDSDFNDGAGDSHGNDHAETESAGSHSHTFTSNSTGGSSSIDNKPSYVEVAFIQKQ